MNNNDYIHKYSDIRSFCLYLRNVKHLNPRNESAVMLYSLILSLLQAACEDGLVGIPVKNDLR